VTRLALIAHDEKKDDLIEFVQEREAQLGDYELIGTGTTSGRLMDETDLEIEPQASGPLGGDLMIGAEVAEGRLDALVFLRDPLTAQPHEPDVSALLRICDVHDVPLATNLASARYLLEGLSSDG